MGVRLTWDEAVAKGYISAREAKEARSKTRSPGDGGNDRNPLQDKFVAAIVERFGGRYNVVPELIPLEGRNFRIDCALPELWLALEWMGGNTMENIREISRLTASGRTSSLLKAGAYFASLQRRLLRIWTASLIA